MARALRIYRHRERHFPPLFASRSTTVPQDISSKGAREDSSRERWNTEDEHQLLEHVKQAETAYEDAMLRLSRYYSKADRPQVALSYMERLNGCTSDPEKKAFCYLSMGQLMEQSRDYDTALEYYAQAMLLEPSNSTSWYFIHNNMGCCLNHTEQYESAEKYCRDAIRIDPGRYNAYINLGVSLEAQDRFIEAARSFLDAIKANADDLELVDHLEEMVSDHDEIASDITNIHDFLKSCRDDAGDDDLDGDC
jgi:tetratricopeptide (TPR) repeat protein